jgi:hypothetical protein
MGIVNTDTDLRWPERRIPTHDQQERLSDGQTAAPGHRERDRAVESSDVAAVGSPVERGDYVNFQETAINLNSPVGRQGGQQAVLAQHPGVQVPDHRPAERSPWFERASRNACPPVQRPEIDRTYRRRSHRPDDEISVEV